MDKDTQVYTYLFELEKSAPISFTIAFDPISQSSATCPIHPPSWAALEYHQCRTCTLSPTQHPFCPVALGISELVTAFQNVQSFLPCKVICSSRERTISKETTVQDGIASILGLQMAISGCPAMDFFRPMARFHLPFATVDESIFRVVACFLVKQLYKSNGTQSFKFDLEDIKKHYAKVKIVNRGILARIRGFSQSDADKNAIVTLNSLAQILEMEIDGNLESLTHIFS